MSFTNVFSSLGESLESAANSFVSAKIGAVIGIAAPIALSGVTLYIVIYGYMVMTGRVQESFYDFCFKCIKIILVAAFSMAGTYDDVMSAIEGFQQAMITSVGESGTIYGSLDNVTDNGLDLLVKINEKNASLGFRQLGTKIGYWIMFAVVATAYLLIIIGIGATIMIAMLFLKILLAFGPIFIMCLMFPPVSRFFDNWFGAVTSNVFVTVIGSTFAVIALKIFGASSGIIDIHSANVDPWSGILGIIAMAIVLFMASRSIASLAAGLGGGVASEILTAGSALATAIGLSPAGRQIGAVVRKPTRIAWQQGQKSWERMRNRRKSISPASLSSPPAQPIYNRTRKI